MRILTVIAALNALIFLSCKSAPHTTNSDSTLSFCVVDHDTVYRKIYNLNIHIRDSIQSFYYKRAGKIDFELAYNSSTRQLSKISKSTKFLDFVAEKIYIKNGLKFNVLEFRENPNIQDGSIKYFFESQHGLLVVKSETWPIMEYILFNQLDSNFLANQAVIQTILSVN